MNKKCDHVLYIEIHNADIKSMEITLKKYFNILSKEGIKNIAYNIKDTKKWVNKLQLFHEWDCLGKVEVMNKILINI